MHTPQSEILVVDLDGTVLNSDMLFETFWSAFGTDWRSPFLSASALLKGKSALKKYLADSSNVDITSLPYDEVVLDYVRNWRANGGQAILVTASNQMLADAIAEHLGVFDGVHGSDTDRNLKGPHKAQFLNQKFGERAYAYMGDAQADVEVWKTAGKAITINASPNLRRNAEAAAPEVEHLQTQTRKPAQYLKALRPHQWLKNILIFLPLLTAHQFDAPTILNALLAFLSFSLIASSVYVLNDLLDLSADRQHPRKCRRPFASGSVPLSDGSWMAAATLAAGAIIALVVGPEFLLVMIGYYVLTTLYSLKLKRMILVDICVLAGLYTVRLIAGGVATGITLSVWMLAFSIFFFFSLAAVKRQAELVSSAEQGKLKTTGRGYHIDDLPIISMMAIGSGLVSVLVLALYLNTPTVSQLYSTPEALWVICCVLLYWTMRAVMLAHRGHMHDDPVIYAVRDRVSQLCGLIILGIAIYGAL